MGQSKEWIGRAADAEHRHGNQRGVLREVGTGEIFEDAVPDCRRHSGRVDLHLHQEIRIDGNGASVPFAKKTA